jgi:hypothetical protein
MTVLPRALTKPEYEIVNQVIDQLQPLIVHEKAAFKARQELLDALTSYLRTPRVQEIITIENHCNRYGINDPSTAGTPFAGMSQVEMWKVYQELQGWKIPVKEAESIHDQTVEALDETHGWRMDKAVELAFVAGSRNGARTVLNYLAPAVQPLDESIADLIRAAAHHDYAMDALLLTIDPLPASSDSAREEDRK